MLDAADKSESDAFKLLLKRNCSELRSDARTRAESWLQERTERVALDW